MIFMPYLVFDGFIKLCTLTSSKSNCIRISMEINSIRCFCKKKKKFHFTTEFNLYDE